LNERDVAGLHKSYPWFIYSDCTIAIHWFVICCAGFAVFSQPLGKCFYINQVMVNRCIEPYFLNSSNVIFHCTNFIIDLSYANKAFRGMIVLYQSLASIVHCKFGFGISIEDYLRALGNFV